MNDQQNLDEFITKLYTGMLGRAPEPGAIQAWRNRMNAGESVQDVTLQFIHSAEFQQRTQYASKLFVPPGHFYSPIVDTVEVTEIYEKSRPSHLPGIDIDTSSQLETWNKLSPHIGLAPFPDEKQKNFRYHYNNPAFSIGDSSVYFAMLLEHRPRRVIEIGSGYSSACALDTIERFFDHPVDMTFIEPFPELLESLLNEKDKQFAKIIPHNVQSVDISIFEALEAGDFLFIDSTHVLKTNSDVHREIFEILPALNPGVIVHIHDMFWPFEYPKAWVVDEGRSWNELYAIRALLMYQSTFKILYFNDYAAHHIRPTIESTHPRLLENSGGSLWLQKVG